MQTLLDVLLLMQIRIGIVTSMNVLLQLLDEVGLDQIRAK